jgi:ribosomal protein S11
MVKKAMIENKKNKIAIKQKKIPKVLSRGEAKLPYIVVITRTPNNLFLNATDFAGNTKIWESSGHCGFHGKSKTAYMAIITTTDEFFKKV